ncbi:rho guanine nucleotide exchange factor 16 [Chanos chanos]|uniref:Rho guanine nucleotide exchange factor 16 n=1 Tax=Chanos chanos TaxID=29144 RepID=A0A6J2W5X9_CHACN|nr:rho guanine nucleotide exchange factor 16 [Chanos chanos]
MSHSQSSGSMEDQVPLVVETHISELRLDSRSSSDTETDEFSKPQRSASNIDLSEAGQPGEITLSTQSAAARKLGTQQLIPKNLALSSRTKKHRHHHTTVVTLPVQLESNKTQRFSHNPDLSWDDYDSDGDGLALRRNRRNKSYRAAVTSLNMDDLVLSSAAAKLNPVNEEKAASPQPVHRSRRKRTLGRKRNQRHGGSFKDEPRLYQQIKERGLQSNNADEDDFTQSQPPDPDQGIVVQNYRASYIPWSQLPQVKDLGILDIISPEERKRQEAIFEIITSEYSYQHSLSILVRHFKESDALRRTMTTTEHHHLFSNISVIQAISKRFFEDLEKRHQHYPVIQDISDIVQNYASQHFQPYIVYCSNETFQQRTLQKLLANNNAFKEVLKQIESSPECGGLPMISFLILPMQRVTRLPLLLDTICQKTPAQTAEYFAACWALKAISKLVKACNDGARRMERTEQMYTIQKQMEFGKIKPFPLVSSSRWLRKRGELSVNMEDLSIFWKAFSHKSYYLFVFNDVLIVTKKKGEESFLVLDYATTENVTVVEEPTDTKQTSSHLYLRLRMNPNSEGRCDQILLVAESKLDKARWVTALRDHRQTGNSVNKDDLLQFEANKAYMPKEPDELSLQQAELVIVLQQVEGWCYGERMRDGQRGWFPASCATQITNRTAMESNIQRMERLRKETNV